MKHNFGTKQNDTRSSMQAFCHYSHSQVGKLRCELSYRRCETSVEDMVRMIEVEVQGVEEIEKELEVGAIDVNDIENR